MIYIPDSFLLDKKNMDKVHELISEASIGVRAADDPEPLKLLIDSLDKIGETKLSGMIKNNEFDLPIE